MNKIVLLFFVILLLAAGTTSAESLKTSWYLHRGRANIEIGNYKAAIEAFEKALETDPENREALYSLGTAYEKQGLQDKAIEQFDQYLKVYPEDWKVAFKQAEVLSGPSYAYRRKDALAYYAMGLRQKNDVRRRLAYAKLLNQKKDTSREAIPQFERVLEKEPHNAEALSGLAAAYAWNGQQEQALRYSEKAEKYGGRQDVQQLKKNLAHRSVPMLIPENTFFTQSGSSDYGLKGMSRSIRGQIDPSSITTAFAELGNTEFWHGDNDHTMDIYFSLGGQYRPDSHQRVDADASFSTIEHFDEGVMSLSYAHDDKDNHIQAGFKRERKYDSYFSLAGKTLSGKSLGAARSNTFYTELGHPLKKLYLSAKPYGGWISARSTTPNFFLGVDLKAETPFHEKNNLKIHGIYLLQLIHYSEDYSGFGYSTSEPLPGGYFSPDLFLNQSPQLMVNLAHENHYEFNFSGGPALQYVKESQKSGTFKGGADLNLWYTYFVTPKLEFKFNPAYQRIANAYNRFSIDTLLVYLF